MNEKERLDKAEKRKIEFSLHDTHKGIKLVKILKLQGVKFEFDWRKFGSLGCYLYHFDKLGITERNLEEEFEGKTLLIYRYVGKNGRRSKCPWCYSPQEDLHAHIGVAHKKEETCLEYLRFQETLYKELLRIVRDSPHYFATMFLNAGCQLCDNTTTPGRELCCSIPTSFRDRARSLMLMGFSATNVAERFVTNPHYGQILLAP